MSTIWIFEGEKNNILGVWKATYIKGGKYHPVLLTMETFKVGNGGNRHPGTNLEKPHLYQ